MTHLYRHFDCRGRLLYVGISKSAIARLSTHTRSKWFNAIARITVKRCKSRSSALAQEREAIIAERPKFNLNGVTRGVPKPKPYFSSARVDQETRAWLAKIGRAGGKAGSSQSKRKAALIRWGKLAK